MSLMSAFEATGKSFSITVGAANQVTPVNLADLGLTQIPSALQFENTGNADVWVVMSSVAAPVAAFPTPGTTTVGTPQSGFRVRPGTIVVYRCNVNDPTQKVQSLTANIVGPGFYLATIGAVAGQNLDVTPGEGV
jgi:hypothetical protein